MLTSRNYVMLAPCPPSTCSGGPDVGTSVFHGQEAALAVARGMNKRAGRKAFRIIVRDHHFRVVKVQP